MWEALLLLAGFVLFVLVGGAFPRIESKNLLYIGGLSESMLPFGALLFALSGIAAIPEIREILGRAGKRYVQAVLIGTLIPAGLYLFFMVGLVGAFGLSATRDITEIVGELGTKFLRTLSIYGVLAVSTSFLVVATNLVDTLHYDLKLRRITARAILVVPYILFLFGVRDFVTLVSFFGIALGVVNGTLLVLTWRRARESLNTTTPFQLRISPKVAYAMIGIFVFGAAFQISTLFL